ncbi:GNAT family N-acetyltransferase [Geodermatophilus marinus]|uniref:GNAT family N-acetyltransferase n=1 Tax=Geodermatophilus sp. LHW52908 TaxID=2303986 RepID=UPI000E3E4C99|nr:GNAT family N-acetyltransferase [Geodermatophilus sp. LHW52908]RFU21530.1 N-acetyltransferase [Geodermatophilus sp. LHW52908]
MTATDVQAARLQWVRDGDPRWDADRERVFAGVPEGVFRTEARRPGERLPGDWWRAEDAGRVVGYGWLDDVWGDAEILLAVEDGARGRGVGAFVLARLEEEAAARGLNYVVNVVRDTHPDRDRVTAWFRARGFAADDEGRLRKRVAPGDTGQRQEGRPGTGRAQPPDGDRRARYDAERARAAARGHDGAGDGGSDRGPGAEEAGGYVDPEHHRY